MEENDLGRHLQLTSGFQTHTPACSFPTTQDVANLALAAMAIKTWSEAEAAPAESEPCGASNL